jgi:hypothetical protein
VGVALRPRPPAALAPACFSSRLWVPCQQKCINDLNEKYGGHIAQTSSHTPSNICLWCPAAEGLGGVPPGIPTAPSLASYERIQVRCSSS